MVDCDVRQYAEPLSYFSRVIPAAAAAAAATAAGGNNTGVPFEQEIPPPAVGGGDSRSEQFSGHTRSVAFTTNSISANSLEKKAIQKERD